MSDLSDNAKKLLIYSFESILATKKKGPLKSLSERAAFCWTIWPVHMTNLNTLGIFQPCAIPDHLDFYYWSLMPLFLLRFKVVMLLMLMRK